MMPGDSQAKTVAIAADATIGNCQNCSVLHQSLSEYVSSFLALKQKITASDETIRHQQQLEELQIRLLSLEKKTADYESVQAELEEKKAALKACGQISDEMAKLKQENSKIIAENKKLQDQINDVNELMETQSLENAQLKREKAVVENDLLEAQTSLMKSQAQADQIKQLMEEKAKTTSIREHLENKVQQFGDSMCKQNHKITQLTKEKILLERNIADLQARLMKLERERSKDYRSTSTQATVPEEHKVDKVIFRSLLENLWACVEPQQHTAKLLYLPGSCSKQVPLPSPPKRLQCDLSNRSQSPHKISEPHSYPMHTNAPFAQLKHSPSRQRAAGKQTSLQTTRSKKKTATPKKSKLLLEEPKTEEASRVSGSPELSVEEIVRLFKPLLPCISPVPELGSEMESLETEDGEKTNISKNSDPLQQKKSSLLTTSVSSCSPKASAKLTEDSMDLPVVRTQEADHISSENNTTDLEQNDIDSIIAMKEEEMQVDTGMQIEQEATSEQFVSASTSCDSFTPGSVDVVLQNTDGHKPSCGVNSDSRGFKSTSDAKDYLSEGITKMDVDTNLSDEMIAKAGTSNSGESPRRADITLNLEQAGDVELGDASATSLASIDSDGDTEVKNTDNNAEIGQVHQDSCGLEVSQQCAEPKERKERLAEDTDAEKTCLSSSSDSNKHREEKLENDAPIKLQQEEDENEVHGKQEEGVNVTASTSLSNGDNKRMTPAKSSPLRMENCTSHQEPGQANSDTPSKKNANIQILNSELADHGLSLSDPQETKTVNCESVQEKTHSLCRALSPSCLFPTVKLHTLETSPNQEELDEGVNIEHISASKKTLEPESNKERESAVKNGNAKDLHEDSTDASILKVGECKLDTVSPTASLKQNASAKKGQNKSLESKEVSGPDAGSVTTHQPECLGQLLTEMGPPLPPVLTPVSTPPKAGKSINPRQAIGKLLFPSPLERLASPTTPVQQSTSSLNSPIRVPSSPLQFGSATPKHAVPVPGRLARTATASSSPPSTSPSQENSMRILDTMYPELSAHARTLSILRGNVSLSCSSDNGSLPSMTASQMSGFKTITSSPTAFTKTEARGEKRQADNLPQPNNRKCLRLENSPPTVSRKQVLSLSSNSGEETISSQNLELKQLRNETSSLSMDVKPTKQNVIDDYLKKIETSCFDLLPVIRSHLFVGNLPKKPVLTDEEKEVISEVCQSRLLEADDMVLAILEKLKAESKGLSSNYMQALCRVHTGICRQKRDWEKAHILAYSILTEDFPDAAKLILFMVTTWPTVLSHSSSLCQAIHAVTKVKAQENLHSCLSVFLSWEKSPPCDIDKLISRTLSDIRSGSGLSFTEHSRHGKDLATEAWQQVFTLHLLCAHKKWKWTYENVLGNELWPLMNTWVTQPRDQQGPVSDVTVSTVLRLIGRLSHLGIKEKNTSSVVTVANVINTFGRHGHTEGVPWEVQLAAIYCIYDLSPVSPKQALEALAGWRGDTSQRVPPAVTSCINQLASVCRLIKN
ncbi:little elongation complex subunit 1 [Notolabrus celidotus]|uniref:little elongation complex subunit 1 n=1 Tax=Notolabrus celidotus TaxID=1203425 RepID=UPI00149051BE|nr:little elongation complex subunit 1 [Notolabrus celidotus]